MSLAAGLGLVLILVSVVLDFVAASRINSQHYEDAKAAVYAAAVFSILGIIAVGVGLATMHTVNKALDVVKENPGLIAELAAL